ncbi:MAG: PAS domain-containing protein [Deltaproteobacteria bacterium]|nr:PAS domain-containing protein [Deltaproteobacteria bacterium]
MVNKPTYEELEQRPEEERIKAETIIESMGDAVCVLSADFRVLYENKICRDAFGIHTGEYCYKVYQNRDQVCERCPVAASFKDGETHTMERTARTEKGILYIENTASPLKDSRGEIIACIEVVRDITKRKRTEQRLHQSEEKLKGIVDSVTDCMCMIDEHFNVVWTNDIAERVCGSDIVGEKCYSAYHGRGKMCDPCIVRQCFEDGMVHEFETEIHRTGEKRTFWCTASVAERYEDGRPKMVVEFLRDMTDRKRAEQALRGREAALEIQANEFAEVNIALRVLLRQRNVDKAELEENVLSNVKQRVLPYVEKAKNSCTDPKQIACLDIVKTNLTNIISSFSRTLSSKYLSLTPAEIEIANLVKQNKTTKEVAEMLTLSSRTVESHRSNIRKKLGLRQKKANLRTHLLSIEEY